jgi:isoleucyl-tRNA synthetase
MDYRETLNLPRTDFPMKGNLPRREPEMQAWWEQAGLYRKMQELRRGSEPFILHDGPPYANGDIHLGTALNKILKDILVKYRTMRGSLAPYVPGWDCHGQPIEHEVEKQLGGEGARADIMEIRKRCQEYAMHFVERQSSQFRRLGVLGDFENPYLTLRPEYEAANIRVFAELHEKGLVYRGRKPIHWCPRCMTALAEAEIEYAEKSSPSIYVKFPVLEGPVRFPESAGPVSLVIWTTTPWTLPANVAIALHPQMDYQLVKAGDEGLIVGEPLLERAMGEMGIGGYEKLATYRGEELAGTLTRHPWEERPSRVVTAEYVTFEQGTGAVHIAPGHGYEDYQVGLENDLPMPMPVDDEGRFTAEAPSFEGVFIEDANQLIIEDLQRQGRLLGSREMTHPYPHCWRCKRPVIFRATPQWFIAVDRPYGGGEGLRQRALGSLDEVEWIPGWNRKRMQGMLEVRPDWCISRQRAWGVPIPVFYCGACGDEVVDREFLRRVEELLGKEGSDAWFTKTPGEILGEGASCPRCGSTDLVKGQDILDVWFESGISHEAVLRTRPELRWPSDMYLEGSDQHRGWFQTSLLTAIGAEGKPPFRKVLTHGFVVDGEGRKMSKSLGNVISPLDICDRLGADVLRLWVAAADYTVDIPASQEIFERLVEAYRRIRNTVRFLLGNLYDYPAPADDVDPASLEEMDRWILSRWNALLERVNLAYEGYQFHLVYQALHHFCAVDLSSLYLDARKDCLYTFAAASRERRSAQAAMHVILRGLLRVMAPILSHTAEEAWRCLRREDEPESVFLLEWPEPEGRWADASLEEEWGWLLELREKVTKRLEEMRASKQMGTSLEAEVVLLADDEALSRLGDKGQLLESLFIVSSVRLERREGLEQVEVEVRKAPGSKCARCWNVRETVGKDPEHPLICSRCVAALRG